MTAAGERVDVVIDALNDPNIGNINTFRSFVCFFTLFCLPFIIITDETIMTVRGIDSCAVQKLQTLARIVFVDDISDYPTRFEHHEPFAPNTQSYESLDYPKIVSLLS